MFCPAVAATLQRVEARAPFVVVRGGRSPGSGPRPQRSNSRAPSVLDAHFFPWYISADPQLPTAFRDSIRDTANEVYSSAVSVWEAVVKHALGRLPLPEAAATGTAAAAPSSV